MVKKKRYVLLNSDYKECRKYKEMFLHDCLTGLYNRWAMYDIYSSFDKDKNIHILYIDIDNFKRVNDSYGHSEGDKLLCAISELLKIELNENRIFRIGGDEFVAFIEEDISEQEVLEKVRKIKKHMNNSSFRKDIMSMVSLSVGVIMDQNVNQILDDVLSKCDSAMYSAKTNGKDKYVIYKALEELVETHRSIEEEMEEALEKGQFQVYLQPQVNMMNSTLEGAEALSRWIHPVDGLRSPGEYIPLFEKNGFIKKLDYYMLEQVCKLKRQYIGTPIEHMKVSVNMSRLHLYNKNFPKEIKQIADKYEVNAKELEIEITESIFFKDASELINMVEKLKEYGFSVSIDDFGSGYSALNMLKDIPVETVKIDQEFLKISSNNLRGQKVIKNIIIMCKELKLNVVAEGVETEQQIEFLTDSGCEVAQGYIYSKPLPVEEFLAYCDTLLKKGSRMIKFSFDGSLTSDDEDFECNYIMSETEPKNYTFGPGVLKGRQALYLPGGDTEKNLISIPEKAILNDSYTISMWLYVEEPVEWASMIFVKFETGFSAIVPNAWEMAATFRIRDYKNIQGWYDSGTYQFAKKKWIHVAATYNAKTEKAVFYRYGEPCSGFDDVPVQRFVRKIYLGGDIYKRSLESRICDLKLYNEVKSAEEIKEMYEMYINDPDFIAEQEEMIGQKK